MDEHFNVFAQWWIWKLSGIAGLVSYLQNITKDDPWKSQLLNFVTRLSTAGFTGAMAYVLSVITNLPPGWDFLLVGVFAWRGTQSLQGIAEWLQNIVASKGAPPSAK